MTNELAVKEKQELIPDFTSLANEYLNALGFKFSNEEAKRFLQIANAYQLNPFKREIYGIQGWDKDKGGILTIIVGYEVYLKRGERTGKLNGYKKTVEFDKDGKLFSATIIIYRKDWDMPFEHTVYFSEFARYTKEGKLMKMWATMPIFMLQKVVLAQGFRMCFPDEMGGLPYIAEEIQEAIIDEERPVGKPYVEMPTEKIQDEKSDTVEIGIDILKQKIQDCLNLKELEELWTAHKSFIKSLSKEDKATLNEQKEAMKFQFNSVLQAEA